MKKNKVLKSALTLNKGRIAMLQAGTILGGEDKEGRQKATQQDCIDTVNCTASIPSVDVLLCQEPVQPTVQRCTY